MRLTTHNEHFSLLPQRAIHWPRRRTLLVADMHLGKPNVFRVAGIPVPDSCPADLARLSSLISAHSPDRLVILGDLLHARAAHSPQLLDALATWRAAHAQLDLLLIRGNHDAHAGDPPASLRFRIENEPFADADDSLVNFAHFPPTAQASTQTLTLCGHLHPAVLMRGPVSSLRADCFYLTPTALVLPAFGAFTGSKVITPHPNDRAFIVGENQVLEASRTPVITPRTARGAKQACLPTRTSP
jgi:uncharacterized protein